MGIRHFQTRETPYWLNFVFLGLGFKFHDKRDLSSSEVQFLQVVTPTFPDNRLFHTIARDHFVQGGGPYEVEFWEDATVTDGTTAIDIFNLDRRAPKTSHTTLFTDPTNVDLSQAKLVDKDFIPSGTGPSGLRAGAFSLEGFERVLKPDTIYILRYENLGDESGTLATNVTWYESDN